MGEAQLSTPPAVEPLLLAITPHTTPSFTPTSPPAPVAGVTNETLSQSAVVGEEYIDRILPSVVAMVILFAISAVGNVTVFFTLVTSRLRKTRISVIILHLTVADLFVTLILIPTEVERSSL